MAVQTASRPARYVLGHSADEQRRLDRQGSIFQPYTERLLLDAGIQPGMRVLDLGCGTGSVTAIAARLVGAGGLVVGIDRSPEMLAAARDRLHSLGLRQTHLLQGDVTTIFDLNPFDAVIGRFILTHMANPARTLRSLERLVISGGLLVFQEVVILDPPLTSTPRPLLATAGEWRRSALGLSGAWPDMGLRLAAAFRDAGLPAPQTRLDGILTHAADTDHYAWFTAGVRSLLPAIERFGIATAADVGIDTLEKRLIAEAADNPETVCAIALGSAWTHARFKA